MSEPSIVPYVKTTPKPFGVDVEWKWPGGCAVLELQCLHEDGRLMKERIFWPATVCLISGLKAGERLQVRLRPIAEDGSARDWRAGDWIEGVSSVDTEEIIEALDEEIRNSCALHGLKGGWFVDKTGKAYIHEALIGDGVVSQNYSVKLNVAGKGKPHEAGMTLGVEGEHSKVEFMADRFKVNEAAQSASNNEETAFNGGLAFGGFPGAISHDGANPADGNNATAEPISSIASATGTATKTRLTDEMQELVLKAVRESDLFTSLQTAIAAQESSTSDLKQALNDAVGDAIRNALKPGGLLYKR
ncbi:phage tail tip fiber protein [Enterobacter ludwigii]|uniref:phage tail tip fiber protein n=1 Tax=Enterobacter ludwigii TaxID=299767 RepID=UPI004069273E